MISLSVTDQGREIIKEDPLYALMYALKSSEARRQYPKRLKMLFDYFKLSGLIEEQAKGGSRKKTRMVGLIILILQIMNNSFFSYRM